jgi:hypothetical protein
MFGHRLSELILNHKGNSSYRDIAKRMGNLISHTAVAKWQAGEVQELERESYQALSLLTMQPPESIEYWLKTGKKLDPEAQQEITKLKKKIDQLLEAQLDSMLP